MAFVKRGHDLHFRLKVGSHPKLSWTDGTTVALYEHGATIAGGVVTGTRVTTDYTGAVLVISGDNNGNWKYPLVAHGWYSLAVLVRKVGWEWHPAMKDICHGAPQEYCETLVGDGTASYDLEMSPIEHDTYKHDCTVHLGMADSKSAWALMEEGAGKGYMISDNTITLVNIPHDAGGSTLSSSYHLIVRYRTWSGPHFSQPS